MMKAQPEYFDSGAEDFQFLNVSFSYNRATDPYSSGGGAIFCSTTSNFVFDRCTFENNAAGSGGAVSLTNIDQVFTIRDSQFKNNSALRGGAVYIEQSSDVLIEHSEL